MWMSVAILLALVLVPVVGYRVMIDVKPKVPRPTMGEGSRAEIHALERRMLDHVRHLGVTIGERNLYRPHALRAAAEYIRQAWTAQGLTVSEEPFEVAGQPCANVVTELKGSDRAREIVVVGAHYDSVVGAPGANDNGTGVALLVEMSRALAPESLSRTVRFVAFVNEEPPYFLTEAMGSRVHARRARRRGEDIVAMLSLETLGYYADAHGSQRYPPPFGALYPSRGNFLAVVGNLPSRRLVVEFLHHFMSATDFPVEAIATFESIPGVNWSDHWSFWKEGYPALMLTDTAPFRYPEYHSSRDLPDRINGPEFARAAHGIIHAVRRLAGSP
jgi:Zn-dependent M28 family amino/carboxypeptidase